MVIASRFRFFRFRFRCPWLTCEVSDAVPPRQMPTVQVKGIR